MSEAILPAGTPASVATEARKVVRYQEYRFDRKFGQGWINTIPRFLLGLGASDKNPGAIKAWLIKGSKSGREAVAAIGEAVALLEQAEAKEQAGDLEAAGPLYERALTCAQKADTSGRDYDTWRSWIRECGTTNAAMLFFNAVVLEPCYRRMTKNGGKRWDADRNWWGSFKEWIVINIWYMAACTAVMGGDYDITRRDPTGQTRNGDLNKADKETRKAFFGELATNLGGVLGTLGFDQWLRTKHVPPARARAYTSTVFGALIGFSSYAPLAPSMRGCSLTAATVRGVFNGLARYGLLKLILTRWFPPKALAAA